MSNKTQLQTNNTKLDALTSLAVSMTEKAAALPEAGSGGGGNVETCTVALSYPVNINSVYCSIYEDGKLKGVKLYNIGASFKRIENVVCGSFFLVNTNAVYTPIPEISGGGEFINFNNTRFHGYFATDEANGVMYVRMVDDD